MSLSESSLRAWVDCSLKGVPVLECCLEGVSSLLGVPGLWSTKELKESLWTSCAVGPSLLLLFISWGLGVRGREEGGLGTEDRSMSGGEEGSGETGVEAGSARELCLMELRLLARTLDQLVERKLSASSQKRTRWSDPRASWNWM